MNTSALNVNDDGTFKLKPEDQPFKSDSIIISSNSEHNPNKRQNKKRGKKKVNFADKHCAKITIKCVFSFLIPVSKNILYFLLGKER